MLSCDILRRHIRESPFPHSCPLPALRVRPCPCLPSGVITLFNDIFPITFVAILNPKRFAGERRRGPPCEHRSFEVFPAPRTAVKRMVTGINIHFISGNSAVRAVYFGFFIAFQSAVGGVGRTVLIKTPNLWAPLHFQLSRIGRRICFHSTLDTNAFAIRS